MTRRLVAAVSVALMLLPLAPAVPANAAEYTMATVAEYAVDPAAGSIGVTVSVTFTNTLPDPPGQISAFTHVDLAIQAGASAVAARDEAGQLAVAVKPANAGQIASVTTRSRVRYNASASFTLTYQLSDGAATDLHIRPEVVKFPAWGFGTSSQVTVRLPAGFDATADGDELTIGEDEGDVVLTSGPIPDPGSWLAIVTAVTPPDYVTRSASIPLATGTVDLQVRAWRTSPAVGGADARPAERCLASSWRRRPACRIRGSGPWWSARPPGARRAPAACRPSTPRCGSPSTRPPLRSCTRRRTSGSATSLSNRRWVRKGLASHYAAGVASGLGVEPPYDPDTRAADLAADAMPLVEWLGDAGPTA